MATRCNSRPRFRMLGMRQSVNPRARERRVGLAAARIVRSTRPPSGASGDLQHATKRLGDRIGASSTRLKTRQLAARLSGRVPAWGLCWSVTRNTHDQGELE